MLVYVSALPIFLIFRVGRSHFSLGAVQGLGKAILRVVFLVWKPYLEDRFG
jgi:hypothetical protein